ncbi:MAG: hypothetical protein ACTMHH_05835, partial [Nesterenkonia sp.]
MNPPRTTTPDPDPLSSSDPVLRHLSDRAGGPAGSRLRHRRGFWSVATVLTAMTVVAVLISALSVQYCRVNGWGGVSPYHWGCYSDVAALWSGRDLALSPWAPFDEALAT